VWSFYLNTVPSPYAAFQPITVTDRTRYTLGGAAVTYQSPALQPANAFATVYRHSTVPYLTFDTPRSLTLIHNSDRAAPLPLVGLDVIVPLRSLSVTSVDLAAQRTGSATLAFTNGETTLHFSGRIAGDSSTYNAACPGGAALSVCMPVTHRDSAARIYGQIDLGSEPTGIIPVTVTLTLHYSDGSTGTKAFTTQLLHVNDGMPSLAGFPIGWTVAGLQRLYVGPSGSGYMIVDGGGPVVWYSALNSSAADYSTLSHNSATATYTRKYLNGTTALFDATGRLTQVSDVYGNASTFVYSSANRLINVLDPMAGRRSPSTSLALTYDGSGHLAAVQETGASASRITAYTVSAAGLLTRITDPDGQHTDFTYDASNRLRTVTDRRGGVTGMAYHSGSGKLLADTLPTAPIDAGNGTTTTGRPVAQYAMWANTAVPRSATSPTAAPLVLRDTVRSRMPRSIRWSTPTGSSPRRSRGPEAGRTIAMA
jgi:YD repeat-containing protein